MRMSPLSSFRRERNKLLAESAYREAIEALSLAELALDEAAETTDDRAVHTLIKNTRKEVARVLGSARVTTPPLAEERIRELEELLAESRRIATVWRRKYEDACERHAEEAF